MAVQAGVRDHSHEHLLADPALRGFRTLSPEELGWTQAETLAYLAGIMDSDGNFRISRRTVAGMRWPQYRINVRCAQASPSPAVQLLTKTFGGQTSIIRERRPHHRDLGVWNIRDRVAVPAIEALIPHLPVKWIDAYLLMALRHLTSRPKENLTSWVHANRWHPQVEMRKRSYSSNQINQFERIRCARMALHVGSARNWPSVPATRD